MTNEQIDDLARALPPYRPNASQIEQVRTAMLAGAPAVTQQQPASRRGAYVVGAVLALAAAAALAWTLRPQRDAAVATRAERHATVVAVGDADFELGAAPDEIVRVRDGQVRVSVSPVGTEERVRIRIGDAEIETRAGALELAVHADHLQWVVSRSGRVDVRPESSDAVLLGTGERWDAPKMAIETPPTAPPEPVAVPPEPVEASPEPARKNPAQKGQRAATTPPAAAMPPAAPGEAEFRAGWAALKAGDPSGAADSFEAARLAKGSAVAEDASFWEGVALARSGKTSKATAALRRFLSKYPSSTRAGEAAAKLGWLLYDAGDLDAAQRYFETAADDVVPKVQKSARDGLAAVERRRTERHR